MLEQHFLPVPHGPLSEAKVPSVVFLKASITLYQK